MSNSEYPLNAWRQTKAAQNRALYDKVHMLDEAMTALDDAIIASEKWNAWYADRSQPQPDVFAGAWLYGYVLLLVHDWDEFPILPKPGEENIWREWNLGANLHEFYETVVAGMAGGWLELAGRDPATTGRMLREQLRAKSSRMTELVNQPVEWFTPKEFTEEERFEDEDSADRERLNELFDLMDQLESFQHALPLLCTIAMTDDNPELGLPNMPLADELGTIDLNHLYSQVDSTGSKLKPILKFLASKGYSVADSSAPDSFWWRHWKAPSKNS